MLAKGMRRGYRRPEPPRPCVPNVRFGAGPKQGAVSAYLTFEGHYGDG
jgi:hypothetical protein